MKTYIIVTYLLLHFAVLNKAWDNDDFEIFDLVEEINQNFYKLLGINQDATNHEVKRAFRNLSILLHPDKNDAFDANIQFRNLVSVYEILKDKSKREKYDKVLNEGLPNWKSALFYYRRVRKLGLFEGSVILFLIITIGQYFFAWAAYLEKHYTAEQLFGLKVKRQQKKNKLKADFDLFINQIPSPSIFNTLPFQIPKFLWNIPTVIKHLMESAHEYKIQLEEKKRLISEEIEQKLLSEQEIIKEREAKKEFKEIIRKRRQKTTAPEKTDEDLIGYSQLRIKHFENNDLENDEHLKAQQLNGGIWTDDDLSELVQLVKKIPGGTLNRWQIISKQMNRNISEVTYMAGKLKEVSFRNLTQKDVKTNIKALECKTTKNKMYVPETNWSQEEQQALEIAIKKHRLINNTDKWDKIADNVPGKTKEECFFRYKYLVELVKAQKNKISCENELIFQINENLSEKKDALESVEKVQLINEETKTVKVGKPKNMRKERKKQFNYSSEDQSD